MGFTRIRPLRGRPYRRCFLSMPTRTCSWSLPMIRRLWAICPSFRRQSTTGRRPGSRRKSPGPASSQRMLRGATARRDRVPISASRGNDEGQSYKVSSSQSARFVYRNST
ncbi:hypothetical protein K523DRAFT_78330 [Schizophyllum commune Tattone D]|nr:hypothetical protein K523DRAFT_78330 [Schizophyllum commune Tattone D]